MKHRTALLSLICATALPIFAQTLVYLDKTKPIEERIDDAVSRMTREEKVALCHAQAKFSSAGVPRLGIPALWWSDGPHGVRAEFSWDKYEYADWMNDSCTAFPALTALAATWNPEMAALYGKSIGEEARYREKNVLLGPGVNICRTPLGGRNFEYMGEDPYLAGTLATQYVKELQKNGVAACVKHFAVNNQEKWRLDVNVDVSDRALYEIYLPAFKRVVQDGSVWAVMGSYNRAWGEHCSHNHRLLVDILRDEWGYDGVVVSDWGGAHDTKQAAMNGLDVEMGSSTNGIISEPIFTYKDYCLADPYLDALRKGEVSDSTLDAKARNIMRLIYRTAMNQDKPFGSFATAEHYDAAQRIGSEAVVLLKNNGILPLCPAKAGRVLVVGENATINLCEGGVSSELKVKDMFTPLDALRKVYGEKVRYAKGYKSGGNAYSTEIPVPQSVNDSLRAEAAEMAKDADVIIYIGGLNKNAYQDCEHTDRYTYNLPFCQDTLISELVKVCPNIIIANISGNAYAMPWLDDVPAVIQSWYLGTMTGPVMADIISGATNPSGKLPFTFPKRIEDCGAHAMGEISYPGVAEDPEGKRHTQKYLDDIFVGYRWYDTKKIPVQFPFGYGLSYTTFEYGKPTASAREMTADGTIEITVPVTNTGNSTGKETVQMYIRDEKSSLSRPLKELKGYSKVEIAPGETCDVKFTVTANDLKYFDDKQHAWIAEPGKFKAMIGSSCTDIRATVPFTLKQ